MTECQKRNSNSSHISLQIPKEIRVDFSGGNLSSDGGVVLLAQLDGNLGLTERLASCIGEWRQYGKIQHSIVEMLRQRIFQIACGYEDCNDADTLRKDPVFKAAAGQCPESGKDLSSQPTLSRLENAVKPRDMVRMSHEFVEQFIGLYRGKKVKRIVIEPDATEDELHGQQEFAFYNSHYGCYCYLPLLVFATVNDEKRQRLVAAVLRPSSVHTTKKTLSTFRRIIRRLKEAFPQAEIEFRADGGFASPDLYALLEKHGVRYAIAMSKNDTLVKKALPFRLASSFQRQMTRQKSRVYGEFLYAAKTWKKVARRIVVKAEFLRDGEDNARFVVTNFPKMTPFEVYRYYTRRGDSENRIDEFKNQLKADRTSCETFLANQFRLLLHAAAFVLTQALQDALEGTELASAEMATIRVKLLKIAALVKETVRNVWIRLSSAFPLQDLFWNLLGKIQPAPV